MCRTHTSVDAADFPSAFECNAYEKRLTHEHTHTHTPTNTLGVSASTAAASCLFDVRSYNLIARNSLELCMSWGPKCTPLSHTHTYRGIISVANDFIDKWKCLQMQQRTLMWLPWPASSRTYHIRTATITIQLLKRSDCSALQLHRNSHRHSSIETLFAHSPFDTTYRNASEVSWRKSRGREREKHTIIIRRRKIENKAEATKYPNGTQKWPESNGWKKENQNSLRRSIFP